MTAYTNLTCLNDNKKILVFVRRQNFLDVWHPDLRDRSVIRLDGANGGFGQFPAVQWIGKYPSNTQIEKTAIYLYGHFGAFDELLLTTLSHHCGK
jgi:hypothetical protein